MCRFVLLAVAGLLAGQAIAGPSEGEPAPDFAISGSNGTSLRGLRDRARVFILFAPAGRALGIQSMKWNAQRQHLGELGVAAGLAERQVIVVVVSNGKEIWPPAPAFVRPTGDHTKIRADYQVPEDQFLAVLVGKDGEVKQASAHPVTAAELFAIIDAMPMRRQEMKPGK